MGVFSLSVDKLFFQLVEHLDFRNPVRIEMIDLLSNPLLLHLRICCLNPHGTYLTFAVQRCYKGNLVATENQEVEAMWAVDESEAV